MKNFLVLILSLSFTITAFAQQDNKLGKSTTPAKATVVRWKDVVAYDINEYSKQIIHCRDYGMGEINKRKGLHSAKDLNKHELKKIKKEAVRAGANVVFIGISEKKDKNPTVYFYYVNCPQSQIKTSTMTEIK